MIENRLDGFKDELTMIMVVKGQDHCDLLNKGLVVMQGFMCYLCGPPPALFNVADFERQVIVVEPCDKALYVV